MLSTGGLPCSLLYICLCFPALPAVPRRRAAPYLRWSDLGSSLNHLRTTSCHPRLCSRSLLLNNHTSAQPAAPGVVWGFCDHMLGLEASGVPSTCSLSLLITDPSYSSRTMRRTWALCSFPVALLCGPWVSDMGHFPSPWRACMLRKCGPVGRKLPIPLCWRLVFLFL